MGKGGWVKLLSFLGPVLGVLTLTNVFAESIVNPLPKAPGKHVDFTLRDRSNRSRTSSQSYIVSRNPISPYMQWMANNGYCGEVSSIEAGMFAGLWMSQFNARLICGTELSQSGPDGFCAANDLTANYNAQFLFEDPNVGDEPFASSGTCLKNAHLISQGFNYRSQPSGIAGYQQFMSWVKERLIAGDTVAIGVLNRGGDDPQYDHEVTVAKIGTNHSPTDSTYFDDDVLYFEDHGEGGTAFDDGYTFGSLAQTRISANALTANVYSILIPGGAPVYSGTGGDGIHVNPKPITPSNYAFAVTGPIDPGHETLPVAVTIVGSSLDGVANPPQTGIGFNFESPAIGDEINSICTNVPPTWMGVSLQATISGLTPGVSYNLYEYDFSTLSGLASAASLPLPDSDFNAHANLATKKTTFTAQTSSFQQTVETTSDKVIVFRCVRADGR